jgi:flagellin-like hook-associated protein FlgL
VGRRFTVFLNNGSGSFVGAGSFTGSNVTSYEDVEAADFNGDGKLDIIYNESGGSYIALGNGNGTLLAPINLGNSIGVAGASSTLATTDVNGDGIVDLLQSSGGAVYVALGNGNGTFRRGVSYSVNSGTALTVGDFNYDGYMDAVATGGPSVTLLLGRGDGSFKAVESVLVANSSQDIVAADLNGDGYLDLATVSQGSNIMTFWYNNGSGTFTTSTTTFSYINGLVAGDFNRDGVTDLAGTSFALNVMGVAIQSTSQTTTMQHINLTTQQGALEAITTLDQVLNRVVTETGSIGSSLSRLEVALNNLEASELNFRAAESRIRDADIAEETSKLVSKQIQQNAAVAVLAQANQTPSLALKLLSQS